VSRNSESAVASTPTETQPIVVHRAGEHHARHHPVQHSQTLMRQAVHYPSDGFKRHAHTIGNTGAIVKAPHVDITPKHSALTIDRSRLERAGQVSHSDYIRRFAANQPAARGVAEFAARPATPQAQSSMVNQMPRATTSQPSNDIFERALAAAQSHKEPYAPVKKHRGRNGKGVRIAVSVVSSLAAIVLIVGFVAYQNMSLIQLKLASSHAGMNATMPIWEPSGFSLGPLTYSHNNVAMTYTNKTSGQSYSISQSPTTWSASDLLNTYVYPNNETYDTLSAGGTTIYTYGANNATWVSEGVWYKLITNGSLSNSQIVNIATSMRS